MLKKHLWVYPEFVEGLGCKKFEHETVRFVNNIFREKASPSIYIQQEYKENVNQTWLNTRKFGQEG